MNYPPEELVFLLIVLLAGLMTWLTWKYIVIPQSKILGEWRRSIIREEIKKEERAQLLENYLKKHL